jgi:hypothetical protein
MPAGAPAATRAGLSRRQTLTGLWRRPPRGLAARQVIRATRSVGWKNGPCGTSFGCRLARAGLSSGDGSRLRRSASPILSAVSLRKPAFKNRLSGRLKGVWRRIRERSKSFEGVRIRYRPAPAREGKVLLRGRSDGPAMGAGFHLPLRHIIYRKSKMSRQSHPNMLYFTIG